MLKENYADSTLYAKELAYLELEMKMTDEKLLHIQPKVIEYGKKLVQLAIETLEKNTQESTHQMSIQADKEYYLK